MSRGSGASAGSGFRGRHVRWATPITHGVRGSTLMASLLPLPDRGALLGERLGALLGVLGLEDRAADLLLELVRFFEVEGEAAQHALLGGLDGEGGIGRDAPGPLVGPLHQLVARDDLVDEAELEGPL